MMIKIGKCARRLGCQDIEDLKLLYMKAVLEKLSNICDNAQHPMYDNVRMCFAIFFKNDVNLLKDQSPQGLVCPVCYRNL